ncbi:MAG: methyl-accepting chemotaxis protein [Myxococcota bacterium]
MSTAELPRGASFLVHIVRRSALLAVPSLVIVIASIATLLDLTPAMWRGFAILLGINAVVASPLHWTLMRGAAAPVMAWLDGPEPHRERTERAYTQLIALPPKVGVVSGLVWLGSTLAVSVGMALFFGSLWSAWAWQVVIVAGATASFVAAVLTHFLVRDAVFDRVRGALAEEIGAPEERSRLAPRIPMRSKLLVGVTGVGAMPVLFAVLIAHHRSTDALERHAHSWTAEILASAPTSEDALAGFRARLTDPVMPVPVTLQPVEAFTQLQGAGRDELERQIDAGVREGNSRTIPGRTVFSWRTFPNGQVWIASVPAAGLYADHTARGSSLLLLLAGALGFAMLVAYYLARDISAPAALLRERAERLADGDLGPAGSFDSEDELGELSRAFDGMTESLRQTLQRLASSADGLESQAGSLGPVCEALAEASGERESATERAAASMEQINAQVADIASSSQRLNESVEESSSSILELGASGHELNETASVLSSKVDEVSISIEEMVRSVKQVSENTESLASAAEETSASMEEMASSLREVDTSAEEAARLSGTVVERSEAGRLKVNETIQGMEAIRDATETVEGVIRNLHGRTEEIGAIVDVIDDVADETNLLALNAAIIAAQAGEHGRAFSVVADEIKDLAERVLASTKEIGGLIRSVQDESQKATAAIAQGSASVASGVELSAEAGLALEEITEASRESGTRIGGIVASLREQAKAAGHVVGLMERVRGGVDEIRHAAAEQDRGNIVVFEGSVTMREVASQVRGTTEEQARGSGRIRESIEGVRGAVEEIHVALQEQSEACAEAAAFLEQLQGRRGTRQEANRLVEGVARELLTRAEELRAEVRRFRL